MWILLSAVKKKKKKSSTLWTFKHVSPSVGQLSAHHSPMCALRFDVEPNKEKKDVQYSVSES